MPLIDILPPELLIEIFVYCSWRDPTGATTLSLVCRFWKDIVHTNPRVWQFISVVDDREQSIVSLQKHTVRWMTRSSPMPFDLDIALTATITRDMILPIFSVVIPQLHRWKTCSFRKGKRREVMDVGRIFHHLRREIGNALVHMVRIEVKCVEDGDEEEGRAQKLPSFETSQMGGVVLNIPLRCLPPPDLINPILVASLTITDLGPFVEHGAVRLLKFLTAFPHLETLIYHGPHVDPVFEGPPPPVIIFPPVVCLPRLRHLVLRSTRAVRAILSHLDVPMLTLLHLEHLNVDFEFQDPLPDEEGDSEDEAPDFSQSPYSDRALGIGLRRLQNRCHPPVQRLIMDYADLRTKDFLFCFENFPLREFRIVASDMSDRVIRMFKPYEDPAGIICVRLPQLVRLELIHCHQFSGNAVVDALSSRARFVDKAPNLPPMEHVAIVECSDVLHQHNFALARVLRSRFYAADL